MSIFQLGFLLKIVVKVIISSRYISFYDILYKNLGDERRSGPLEMLLTCLLNNYGGTCHFKH
jgi:hypothetical protein